MNQTVGARIQAFRERLPLSVDELAKAARLNPALVAAIEAGEAYPAIGTLARLARALGQRLGTFMDDQFREDPLVVRKSERQAESAFRREDASGLPYRYFPLGRGKTDRHMEPFFIEIEPGKTAAPSSHEGEEFLVCVSGRVKVLYGDKTRLLEPGDSIYYNSIVPHEVSAAGPGKAEIYAVVFVPL
ncbi:MAG: cupin domain-containing protein [Kiritimatiellia bacterium]